MWHYGFGMQPEPVHKRATLQRMRAIDDYEPQNLARQSDVLSYLTEGTIARRRPPWLFGGAVTTLDPPPGVAPADSRRRLLDLMAMRFLVVPAGIRFAQPALSGFLDRAGYVLADDGPATKVFENPSALPRAYVTYRVLPAPADADRLLAIISRPAYDPLAVTYVEGEVPGATAAWAPRGQPARFVRDDEAEVELEATLERPGLVVLADSFYPGWHATVDGEPAPILPANHLFRGVPAGAGTHRVRFVYAPASLRLGAACTLVALVVLAACYVAGRSATAATLRPSGSLGTTRSVAASAR
jgi:hypothetical protein